MFKNIELIKNFLKYLVSEKGCRKNTTKAYLSDLQDFNRYIESKSFYDCTEEDIKEYKYSLVSKKLAPRTVNRRLSAILSLYDYLIDQEESPISRNPARNVRKIKVPRTIPIVLNESQAEILLNGTMLTGRYGVRDHAIFVTFMFTALRVSELVNLKVYDVDLENNLIHIRDGKGGKDRLIPIVPRLANALRIYLNNQIQYDNKIVVQKRSSKTISKISKFKSGRHYFLKSSSNDCQTLFLNNRGEKFTEKGIEYLFKKYTRDLGIYKEGLSLHALRRSCLTFLHNVGVDLFYLREISGHARIETLEHYLHINNSKLSRAVEKHPLANQGLDYSFVNLIRAK